MRFFALLAAFISTAAAAETVDCNVVKNTMQPLQLRYHDPSNRSGIIQIFREKSGDLVVWIKTSHGSSVTKSTLAQGILQSAEITTTRPGKLKSSTNKFTMEGMPPNFDRRSDIQYTLGSHLTWADGSTRDLTETTKYTFKSETTVTVNSCVLTAVHGELENTSSAHPDQTIRQYEVYYPELMLPLASRNGEPTIDDIQTQFTPMTPIE